MSGAARRATPRAAVAAIAPLAAVPLVAGCLPTAVTAEGRAIGNLYSIFVVIAAGVFVLVYGLATFAILRYRVFRGRDTGEPRQIHGNDRIEAIWTAIPLLIVAGLFVGTLGVLLRTEARAASPAAEVHVRAFRWGWAFRYPNEGVEASGFGIPGPELVVPVDEPVRFVLTSDDVVHSFYVPLFLFKRDVVPGRVNTFDVTVEEPGTYRGQCAEFCGIGHSAMPFAVRAVSAADYAAWLDAQRAAGSGPPVATPATTFLPVGSAAS